MCDSIYTMRKQIGSGAEGSVAVRKDRLRCGRIGCGVEAAQMQCGSRAVAVQNDRLRCGRIGCGVERSVAVWKDRLWCGSCGDTVRKKSGSSDGKNRAHRNMKAAVLLRIFILF